MKGAAAGAQGTRHASLSSEETMKQQLSAGRSRSHPRYNLLLAIVIDQTQDGAVQGEAAGRQDHIPYA